MSLPRGHSGRRRPDFLEPATTLPSYNRSHRAQENTDGLLNPEGSNGRMRQSGGMNGALILTRAHGSLRGAGRHGKARVADLRVREPLIKSSVRPEPVEARKQELAGIVPFDSAQDRLRRAQGERYLFRGSFFFSFPLPGGNTFCDRRTELPPRKRGQTWVGPPGSAGGLPQ